MQKIVTTAATNPHVHAVVANTVTHLADGSVWKAYDFIVDHLAEKIATHLFELEQNAERKGE